MNVITETWGQLVRRKLWPVALLLVAALIAVPLALAKEPEITPVAAVAPGVKGQDSLPATFVSAAEVAEDAERRRVLGGAKDPFEPAPLPKSAKKKKATPDSEKTVDAKPPAPAPAPDKGAAPSGPSSEPPPSTPPVPEPTVPLYTIDVRFGQVDGDPAEFSLERLMPLGSPEAPVLVYLGVEDGGKTAVFLVTGDVTAQGDGTCDPSPEDCHTLRLRKGETEFLDIKDTGEETDAQYQLDLVRVHLSKTTDAEKAKASKAKSAVAGSKLVKKETRRRPLRYRFDEATGTLRKLDSKSYKQLLSRTRRAAL